MPRSSRPFAVVLPLVLALASPPAFAGQPDEATAAPEAPQPEPAPTEAAQPAVVPAPVYQPAPQPMPEPIPAPPPVNRNRGLGLMIAGISVFSFSYLISAVVGVIMIDTNSPEIGQRLLIPLAGPFMAIGPANTATGGFGLAFVGLAQVAGFGMAIGGGVMFGRSRSQARLSAAPGGLQLRF